MQAAPVLIGADLSQLDAFTLALLTNDEVLDVDLDPLGKAASRVWKQEKLEIWSRQKDVGDFEGAYTVTVPRHGAVMLRIGTPTR